MRCRVLIAVMGILLAVVTVAKAEQLGALLTGYEEAPSVSTTGRGSSPPRSPRTVMSSTIRRRIAGCRGP